MKISMAHGSGGNATKELIATLFQENFANPILNRMEDAAILPTSVAPMAMTTDSFVVTPLFFPGGDIGKLAVYGTANDLSMMGAIPQYLTAGFILEEGLDLEALTKVVKSMKYALKETNMQIVAGDTKVIEGKGGIYINTTGIGSLPFAQKISAAHASRGDAVIVSGFLGNHHACIYAQRMGIENQIKSDCAYLGEMVQSLLNNGLDVHVLRDITRGGLATVLNEIAEASKVNIIIEENLLPVDPEVRSFCDILGLDPLYMANEGKFLCIVPDNEAQSALSILKAHPLGKDAAIIGQVTPPAERTQVLVTTKLGGQRILDILYGQGLPRIC